MNNQTTLTNLTAREILKLHTAMNDYLSATDILNDAGVDVNELKAINNKLIASTIDGITNAEAAQLMPMAGWYTLSNIAFTNGDRRVSPSDSSFINYNIDEDYSIEAIKDIIARSVLAVQYDPIYTVDKVELISDEQLTQDVKDYDYSYRLGDRADEVGNNDVKMRAYLDYDPTARIYVSESWIEFFAGYTLEMILDEMLCRQLEIHFCHQQGN